MKSVTLKQLSLFTKPPINQQKLNTTIQFLSKQLPSRFGHALEQIYNLSPQLKSMKHMNILAQFYEEYHKTDTQSFAKVLGNIEYIEAFDLKLHEHVDKMVTTLQHSLQPDDKKNIQEELNEFLDYQLKFLLATTLLLSAQKYILHNLNPSGNRDILPLCSEFSPVKEMRYCINDFINSSIVKIGQSPRVELKEIEDCTIYGSAPYFSFVHLEILKNSLNALIQKYGLMDVDSAPPIVVTMSGGKNTFGIRITDEAGGMPYEFIKRATDYFVSTTQAHEPTGYSYSGDFGDPLAGFGVGLPRSRTYCRFFGGDLQIWSLEGHGTDVFTYWDKLGKAEF